MNVLSKYLESIRQYSFPKRQALEHELDAVRKAHSATCAELEQAQENLRLSHEIDAQLLADLQQQVKQGESERSNARERVEHLERSLADAKQRQISTEEHMTSLEVKLEDERKNARDQIEHLERSLTDAAQRLKSTEEHMTSLEAKLEDQRNNAHDQIEHLERSLTDAAQRLKSTEEHMTSLEVKLEKDHQRHEESMHATENLQAHIQAEQQSQLKQQTELANTFHRVSTRLFESIQDINNKRRYSLLQLVIIACILFVTGTLIGVLSLQSRQDDGQELAVIKQDISEMRGFMKQQIDNQDLLAKQLSLGLNSQLTTEQALVVEETPQQEALIPEVEEQQQEAMTFTPDIRELQANLIALGFDLGLSEPNGELGIKTQQALHEFRQFYMPFSDVPDDVISEPLVVRILKSADLARTDAARFNIGSDVLAAIRLGSIRTGVDFSFLMELARVESNFNPTVRAPKSSATGLFQFRDYAWLVAIKAFGADYGLKDYATQVELSEDREEEQQPIVRDSLQLEVLALRLNPRLSTLLAAENIKRNFQELSDMIGREPRRADLYLSHLLGTADAAVFLKALEEEPDSIAADIFPEAAARNPSVFLNRQQQPRNVSRVYQWVDRKFNTNRYDDRYPG
jgi:peptidoglycan hydrolase-like protein with peptidoglycan-binding domain